MLLHARAQRDTELLHTPLAYALKQRGSSGIKELPIASTCAAKIVAKLPRMLFVVLADLMWFLRMRLRNRHALGQSTSPFDGART